MGAQSTFKNREDSVRILAPKFDVSMAPKMGPQAGPKNGAPTIVGIQKAVQKAAPKTEPKIQCFACQWVMPQVPKRWLRKATRAFLVVTRPDVVEFSPCLHRAHVLLVDGILVIL